MKKIFGIPYFLRRRLMNPGGLSLMLVSGVLLLGAGCGKKEEAAPAPPPPPAAAAPQPAGTQETAVAAAPATPPAADASSTALAPPTPAVPQVTTESSGGLTFLQQLNRATLPFKMQNRRNPATPEELAAFAGVQLPPPPAGKKYAMSSRGFVVLVDAGAK